MTSPLGILNDLEKPTIGDFKDISLPKKGSGPCLGQFETIGFGGLAHGNIGPWKPWMMRKFEVCGRYPPEV